MDYVNLGNTGLKVSRLCLGCMSYGSSSWREWVLDEAEAMPFFRQALDLGINFFDTADIYSGGESECITGKALGLMARREDVVIATKVGLRTGEGPNARGLSRKHIMQSIDASLKRLGTDYVDLYQIHRYDYTTPIEETLEALNDVVRAGKALHLGASSMFTWQFASAVMKQRRAGYAEFVSMQNFYNLVYREEEREMIPFCRAEGIGLIPWSPIARGFLAGNRPQEGDKTVRGRTDDLAHGYFGTAQDYAIAERVARVADKLGVKPAQAALAWLLAKPGVSAPIIGATKPHHLDDAAGALSITLDALTIEHLEEPYQPRAVAGHD